MICSTTSDGKTPPKKTKRLNKRKATVPSWAGSEEDARQNPPRHQHGFYEDDQYHQDHRSSGILAKRLDGVKEKENTSGEHWFWKDVFSYTCFDQQGVTPKFLSQFFSDEWYSMLEEDLED